MLTTEEKKQRLSRISRLCRMAGNIASGLASRPDDGVPYPNVDLAADAVDIALRIEDKVKDAVK